MTSLNDSSITMNTRFLPANNVNIERQLKNYKLNNSVDVFNEKQRKFISVLKHFRDSSNQSLCEEIIITGRDFSDYLLHIYDQTSNPSILIRALEVHQIFAEHYSSALNDAYFIKDKCKYLANHILILFHLNKLEDVKRRILEFKEHFKKFLKYLPTAFHDLSVKMTYLFKYATVVSVVNDYRRLVDINHRNVFEEYESRNGPSNGEHRLQRAVIIGSCTRQACYRGYTIDLFRISQAIEYKPENELRKSIQNLRKWIFYNASIYDVLLGLNEAAYKMSKHGIMLFYVNGDDFQIDRKKGKIDPLANIGVAMQKQMDENDKHQNEQCLWPIDIISLVVCPTVVIVDSKASNEFHQIKDHIKYPLLCLLSPRESHNVYKEDEGGKLFTFFLTSPLEAFCWICDVRKISIRKWEQTKILYDQLIVSIDNDLMQFKKKANFKLFMEDSVCRALFLRYLFCNIALRLHDDFPMDGYFPKCNFVEIEAVVVSNKEFQNQIYNLAECLDSVHKFAFTKDLSLSGDSIDVVC